MDDLQKTLEAIKEYIEGVWIKKRYIIICTWLFCPALMGYVFFMPDEYESETSVYVDTRSALRPLLQGVAVQSNPGAEVAVIVRTLLSRVNLEKLARETDLDVTVTSDKEYEDLLDSLESGINVSSKGGRSSDRIYTITYSNENPVIAQRVVQETLDLFIEGTLGETREGTDTANRFLDDQIAEYEQRLTEGEQRLANFKRRYSNLLPVQGTFYSNLSERRAMRKQIELQIAEVQQQINALKERLEAINSATNLTDGLNQDNSRIVQTQFDSRIDSLRAKLDELQIRYTDLHPDVIKTRNLLETLEKQRDAEVKSYIDKISNDPAAISSDNPFAQQLALELSRLEGELVSLQVRKTDIDAIISDLTDKIDQVPLVEAELTALNRDYGITKDKYEQLLSRRESAAISRSADVSNDDIKFRVIVPPRLPTSPSGPKRLLFYTAALLFGFGSGFGLALLISQLSPVVLSANTLNRVTDIPILGHVTHTEIDAIKKDDRLRIFIFALSCLTIFSLYIALMAIELLNIDVVAYIERLL
ncbi:XrtA system polysaccharide chain length determinant [Alteromonas oceanisediminis]|uniref:XrtA system polysaccharide chain length determinant n=1 Tax=Alteromonas oceanisediminis TaxID=2836180 RepID=UPI001BD96D86|nr:XrtA system polysaccharide chain length determinant [Alteromonas oceanisediminis]MBT0585659.1 chain-length determining protein [Alteromonas oceanisediminis]